MNVGIAGTFSAINRHVFALRKMQNIRISGRWSVNGTQDKATDLNSQRKIRAEEIIEQSDALIITEKGSFYNQLAILALRKARHVFLYPSVPESLNEVYQLIKTAREANVILQCGRTGQFSMDSLRRSMHDLKDVRMIELQHVFKISGTSESAPISDIVLGDMEIIHNLIKARNTNIKAKGLSMFSTMPEIINSRLEFDNGSAVNYYCNKVGTQNEHNITIMLKGSVFRYSLINNEISGWYLNKNINQSDSPVFIENFRIEQTDHLYDDLSSFFRLIHSGPAFLSIYDSGFESFVLTDRILEKVSKTLVQLV